MPRRKAQAQPFSPGTETSLANGEASTPADFGAAEPSKAAAAATATNASSRMIHKQMKLEGIEAYELPKAVLARVAKAEVCTDLCTGHEDTRNADQQLKESIFPSNFRHC